MGVAVIAGVPARIDHCQVSIRDPFQGREVPIWVWDNNSDIYLDIRIVDDGAASNNLQYLQPTQRSGTLPAMMVRSVLGGSGLIEIAFRGQTLGFGAGTVEPIVLVTTAAPDAPASPGGIPSARGLPLPGW